MREALTMDVLANTICMLRAQASDAILLVDDKRDQKFYERCAHELANILTFAGLSIPLLDMVLKRGFKGVCAAVRGIPALNVGVELSVFSPDAKDTDLLVLSSVCCSSVLVEVTGRPWIVASGSSGEELIDRLLSLSRLLMPTVAGSPNIRLAIEDAVDWTSLLPRSRTTDERAKIPNYTRLENLQNVESSVALEVIAAATRCFRPKGISPEKTIMADDLGARFRAAFPLEHLEVDGIFWSMRAWERINSQFRLLAQWRVLDSFGDLWDQRYWRQDLANHLRRGVSPLTCIKLDLDNFKAVNDQLGHSSGDEAIRLASQTIKSVVGSVGDCYRRGGDEFLVLAPHLPFARAQEVAEAIRQAVQLSFSQWEKSSQLRSLPPTASLGLVTVIGSHRIETVVDSFDDAQKSAKKAGKNTVIALQLT